MKYLDHRTIKLILSFNYPINRVGCTFKNFFLLENSGLNEKRELVYVL